MKIAGVLKRNISCVWKYWLRCIGVFTGILSVVFLFVSWEDIGIKTVSFKAALLAAACLMLLIWSVLWICVFRKQKVVWQNASGRLIVRYGDILRESFHRQDKGKRLYVIPVNSAFDTVVDPDVSECADPLVSPNSLHGRWIGKMVESGKTTEEIDREIREDLRRQSRTAKRVYTAEERERGKRECYELGTIAVVKGQANSDFLLLALTDFDAYNKACVSLDDYERIINMLLTFYDRRGQGYELAVPLMGTGFSNTGLDHEAALRTIVSLFQLHGNKIRGDVSIIIYQGDRDKVSIGI